MMCGQHRRCQRACAPAAPRGRSMRWTRVHVRGFLARVRLRPRHSRRGGTVNAARTTTHGRDRAKSPAARWIRRFAVCKTRPRWPAPKSNRHCQGRRFDDEFLWPIPERAEALGVPIYVHPTCPPQPPVDVLYARTIPRKSPNCRPSALGHDTSKPRYTCSG
jgi:hypothetical protein